MILLIDTRKEKKRLGEDAEIDKKIKKEIRKFMEKTVREIIKKQQETILKKITA